MSPARDPRLDPAPSGGKDTVCPRCGADQRPRWDSRTAAEMEGRDWHCPGCREYLMMLSGWITVLRVPPPPTPGASPLPPGEERR